MQDHLQLHIIAALLRRGRALDQFSTGMTLLALAWGLWLATLGSGPLPGAWAVLLVVLGLVEKYFAARVAFDAELFSLLAVDKHSLDSRTADLDAALAELALQPVEKAGRPWANRCKGAIRLLRQQVLWAGLQLIFTVGAIVLLPWLT